MDISTEIAAIQAASQGSELRQPLVGALNKLNSGSLPAVTASDVGKILKVGANGWEVGEKSGYIPITQADEGKVVHNSALTIQTSTTKTKNGIYDTTLNNEVVVNVQGGGTVSLYKQLLYVQGDGIAYIDTGIAPSSTTWIILRMGLVGDFDTNTTRPVFGSRNALNNGMFALLDGTLPSLDNIYIKVIRFDYGDSYGDGTVNVWKDNISTIDINTVIFNRNGFYFNDNSYAISGAWNNNANSIYLLACNQNGSIVGNNASIDKIFTFTIGEGSTILADFVPCIRRSDSAVGFYDRVSDTFFGNAASGGALIAGPEIGDV